MDVGLFVPFGNGNATPEILRAAGPAIESRGFESIWVAEDVVLFEDYASPYPYSPDGKFPGGAEVGILEPLTALTYLAAVTDRVRLGTGICLVPQRNPVYTAKQVTDLDSLSGGRVDFGVGIGWLKEEFDVLGMPFERRGQRTDDHLQVMKTLWTDEVSEFHGELYDLPPCSMFPKPIQTPHPPIHVGGESAGAMRRVARHGQGWFSFNRLPEELPEPLERLDVVLAEHGRSRSDITLSVCPYFNRVTPEMVAEYAAVGVDRLIVLAFAFDIPSMNDHLDELVETVLKPAQALAG